MTTSPASLLPPAREQGDRDYLSARYRPGVAGGRNTMSLTQTHIDDDAVMLTTRIPEWRRVEGLHYGAHVSMYGSTGYYVRLEDGDRWGVARMTPADDELVGDDDAIVAAISDELSA